MAGDLGDLLRKAGLRASAPAPEPAPAAPAPAEPVPFPKKLVVRTVRKGHGGKTVTEVLGLLGDHELLARRLAAELGVGGRAEGEVVVVQGDQVERVARWLEAQGVEKVQR